MFIWDESIHCIDVPAAKVVHLFRSMRDVQLALPGLSAQQASAYLCQYKHPDGIATFVAFHLHKSGILAFYFSDPRVVAEKKSADMLDQGLNFVESMGFLLTDQDIHLMEPADLQKLWESLPLKAGLADEKSSPEPPQAKPSGAAAAEKPETPAPGAAGRSSSAAKEKPVVETPASSKPVTKQSSSQETGPEKKPEAAEGATEEAIEEATEEAIEEAIEEATTSENVDDLLAAVEAMRATGTGPRARKTVPSAEEMQERKVQLRETVGRILATL